jgi:2-isopropylmalate synthase
MHVYERSPYSGALVFAAFSGSHQDAIAKGMNWRKEKNLHEWTVPYIPIDPTDIGRTYDADVIRINSQSGKGGIGYLLENKFGFNLPAKMREHVGYTVKGVSDHKHKELSPDEVWEVFANTYLNRMDPMELVDAHFIQKKGIFAVVSLEINGEHIEESAKGNGRLDAVSNAIKAATGVRFTLESYSEHSLDMGSSSRAVSYVGLKWANGEFSWGAGMDTDIINAGIKALVSAVNNRPEGVQAEK